MSALRLGTITTSRKGFPCTLCQIFREAPWSPLHDNSACFEAKEGNSSPNSHDFALAEVVPLGLSSTVLWLQGTLCLCLIKIDSS